MPTLEVRAEGPTEPLHTRLPTAPTPPELKRRITHLMLFRVVVITLVLGTTVLLHLASPEELALPSAVSLFAIIGATYALTLVYAFALPHVDSPLLFADGQVVGDLLITTILVHLTGGAQSGYAFFYPLSIIGAATVRYRRGAIVAAGASVILFVSVSIAGWLNWIPTPTGQRLAPWDMPTWMLVKQLVLNDAAFIAVAVLAAFLGEQLAHAGERLETQRARTADLAALNENIIRCLSSGLLTVDPNGNIFTFNQAAEEILGVPQETVLSHHLGSVLPELDSVLATLDQRASMRRAEISVSGRDGGKLQLGISVSPLTDHRDTPIGRIASFQDLTELRRMEDQMLRSQRLAVVGQLAAGVAHEIRNPLASISGSIELLKHMPQVDEESRALMDIILREVDRLNGLITDLLEYARPREPMPLAIELAPILAETVRVFAQDRTNPGVTVRFDPGEDETLRVIADPAQVRQVLWNLLRNAAEAIPERGEIVVALHRARDDDRFTEISVADTGVGIAPRDQERIFDPFYTTKSRGSGLGLPTVHRIVTENNGTVAVDSAPSRGTTVTIRLPMIG